MPTVATLGAIFILVWLVILALYIRSSRQQEHLEQELDGLEHALDMVEAESDDVA